MENKNMIIAKAKEIILNSPFAKYKSYEDINNALEKVYVCKSKEELYELFFQKTGKRYDAELKGFNNNQISYLEQEASEHEVIHEVLHSLSSTFNNNGNRLTNGVELKNSRFGAQLNEGLTEYLAYKLSGKDTRIYKEGKSFFEQIDENFSKYFNNESALVDMYCNNKVEMLKEYMQVCLSKNKNSFEELYENFSFMNQAEINSLVNNINKGAQKILKSREFFLKHPMLGKIKSALVRNKNVTLLSGALTEGNSNVERVSSEIQDLKSKVYGPGENYIKSLNNNPDVVRDEDKSYVK